MTSEQLSEDRQKTDLRANAVLVPKLFKNKCGHSKKVRVQKQQTIEMGLQVFSPCKRILGTQWPDV